MDLDRRRERGSRSPGLVRRFPGLWRRCRPHIEVLEERRLLSQDQWISPNGGNWNNPANWSTGQVPGPANDAVINVPGNVTITYQGRQPTVQTIENYDTIWVNGSNAGGDAILTASQAITNYGTILLQSSNSNYQSNIATGSSTLTNLGTITSSLGSGGNRIVSGTLNNQGTVAGGNDYLEITGTYVAQGGTTTGSAELYNCALFETASPASASTIIATSVGDTLETDNLSGYTIWVNGNGLFNTDAILKLGGNVSNLGTILLQSSNSNYQSNIATGSSTLTNLGTITSSLGSGGNRIVSGTLNNQGTVAGGNDYLEITGTYVAQGGTTTGQAELYQLQAVRDRVAGLGLDDHRDQRRRRPGHRQPVRLHDLGQRQRPVQHRRHPRPRRQ